jgi:nicotinamidase-related amidase
LDIDTVIIVGRSTSGCIRATAEASFDHNLRTIVAMEAVGDRSPTAHEANLFDIDARYADVVPVASVLEYLEGINLGRED